MYDITPVTTAHHTACGPACLKMLLAYYGHDAELDDLVATVRSNHIKRVRDGKCTTVAGLTYLDILVNIERISDQCSNLGVYTLSQSDATIMSNHHEYIHQLHQGVNEDYNRKYKEAHEKYFGELAAEN